MQIAVTKIKLLLRKMQISVNKIKLLLWKVTFTIWFVYFLADQGNLCVFFSTTGKALVKLDLFRAVSATSDDDLIPILAQSLTTFHLCTMVFEV